MACGGSHPNWTASNWAQLGECFTAATTTGAIITITGNLSGTSQLTWSMPQDASLIGQGATITGPSRGGGDVITITDNLASDWLITLYMGSGVTRVAGLTLAAGAGATEKFSGFIRFFNFSGGRTRVDHCHLSSFAYTAPLIFYNDAFGVVDHCIFDVNNDGAFYFRQGAGTDQMGNLEWASNTDFGTERFMYVEDCTINGNPAFFAARTGDCQVAGRFVIRYNELNYCTGNETHATGGSTDSRGCRAHEHYRNNFHSIVGQANVVFDMCDISSGVALVWGNNVDANTTSNVIVMKLTRHAFTSYQQSSTPTSWGYAGPAYASGTVNTTSTGGVGGKPGVTVASGPNFSTSWPSGTMIIMNTGVFSYQILSVDSTTSLTLTGVGFLGNSNPTTWDPGNTGGTPIAYVVGSPWDENSNTDNGYACIDQLGRGKGDMLTGFFPTKSNSDRGTSPPANCWPRQAVEPAYIWDNAAAPYGGGTFYHNESAGQIQANRDYYGQLDTGQTAQTSADGCGTSCAPFNGISGPGIGWGRIAQRPTTCTSGFAYWATNEGSWNTSGDGRGSGNLYKCVAGAWSPYYTPYAYPHPLRGESAPIGPPMPGGVLLTLG